MHQNAPHHLGRFIALDLPESLPQTSACQLDGDTLWVTAQKTQNGPVTQLSSDQWVRKCVVVGY